MKGSSSFILKSNQLENTDMKLLKLLMTGHSKFRVFVKIREMICMKTHHSPQHREQCCADSNN